MRPGHLRGCGSTRLYIIVHRLRYWCLETCSCRRDVRGRLDQHVWRCGGGSHLGAQSSSPLWAGKHRIKQNARYQWKQRTKSWLTAVIYTQIQDSRLEIGACEICGYGKERVVRFRRLNRCRRGWPSKRQHHITSLQMDLKSGQGLYWVSGGKRRLSARGNVGLKKPWHWQNIKSVVTTYNCY